MSNLNILPVLAAAILAGSLSANIVHADDNEKGSRGKYSGENRGKPLQPAQNNAKFQQECSSCHIA